jgi:hypothetical protein
MKITEIIDRKVLFLHYPASKHQVHEGIIKELSPSKNFVKIGNEWYLIDNIRILEMFPEENKKLGFY